MSKLEVKQKIVDAALFHLRELHNELMDEAVEINKEIINRTITYFDRLSAKAALNVKVLEKMEQDIIDNYAESEYKSRRLQEISNEKIRITTYISGLADRILKGEV